MKLSCKENQMRLLRLYKKGLVSVLFYRSIILKKPQPLENVEVQKRRWHVSIRCWSTSTDKHNSMLEMPIMKPEQTKVWPILPGRKKTKAECVSGVLCLHRFSGEKKSTFHLIPPNWLHQDSPCTALSFLPFIIPPVKDMLPDIADSSEVSRIPSLKTQTFCVLLCLQVWSCSRGKTSTCCGPQLAADKLALGFIDNEL